ncbi:MAG: hypothetical protein NT049_04025 [Planctomycetota bacterium]|nr:hypothetical protein [Planctomycetota bacterium]
MAAFGSAAGIVEEPCNRLDRLRVAPNAQTAEHAREEAALHFAKHVAQDVVDNRVRQRLQAVAGHVREFLVRQKRRQRRDGVFRRQVGQVTAGVGLVFLRRIGALDDSDGPCRLLFGRHWRKRRNGHALALFGHGGHGFAVQGVLHPQLLHFLGGAVSAHRSVAYVQGERAALNHLLHKFGHVGPRGAVHGLVPGLLDLELREGGCGGFGGKRGRGARKHQRGSQQASRQ